MEGKLHSFVILIGIIFKKPKMIIYTSFMIDNLLSETAFLLENKHAKTSDHSEQT